ncbi:lamin tail domain-containing protein [Thauera sinica]|uniref:Lamin tail domain-containing protein n=1 Tax=Thauera sinica TaxID=2665146 RepID=A0ABW1AL29_9RHOO|nr:lamin tail domain-containing protein [Thauera sp. K11]ATE62073.1 PEP-CTERM sorting domain-containing protein [Thauera sp. K11]
MNRLNKYLIAIAALIAAGSASAAHPSGVVITEWMYQGANDTNREFIEFTNLGPVAVDFTGWSYDDDSRNAGTFPLSFFGIVESGESIIITEMNPNAFRTAWGLDASVKVWGPYTNNLGNGDEINLYDNLGTLVDRLKYGNNPRTRGISGHATSAEALGANDVSQWIFSSVGDSEGSWQSTLGDIGSPGRTAFAAAVPEPETYAMLIAGLGLIGALSRRRAQR